MGEFNWGTDAESGNGSGGGAREEGAWGEGSVSFCEECPMKGGRGAFSLLIKMLPRIDQGAFSTPLTIINDVQNDISSARNG